MSKITQNWVLAALQEADSERSKLTERERDIFGLSSRRLKHFINNVNAAGEHNYLEIGTYKGATLIAAMRGNKINAYGVDNFMYDDREANKWAPEGFIWDNMKSQLEANINTYRLAADVLNGDKITMIEGDFRDVDWTGKPKFDVCFFDVSPVNREVYEAFFEKVLPTLAQESVVIFSQQSNSMHAKQLNEAMLKHQDKFTILWEEKRLSGATSDASNYYSGIRICGMKKKAVATKPTPAPAKPTSNTASK